MVGGSFKKLITLLSNICVDSSPSRPDKNAPLKEKRFLVNIKNERLFGYVNSDTEVL